MLKAIFFDLDGTLLPMNEDEFTRLYFDLISEKVKLLGYEKEKLIACIWQGTKLMYKNDSDKTNEEVFWKYFTEVYGIDKLKDKVIFDDFYLNEFKQTEKICGKNPFAQSIIKYAKKIVEKVILTTNPIFPLNGIKTRMEMVGLKSDDFDYITSYENSYHCKPSPKYFQDVLTKFDLKSDEVILFGNNDIEDYLCAKEIGIKCYLVGENLILHKELGLMPPIIKLTEVNDIIKQEYEKSLH